jgi:hypothetical protein
MTHPDKPLSWFAMPTKVGAFRYAGLFDDCSE